jgi:heat shock protein beta
LFSLSTYFQTDIFLRELISNAADALDKLRLTALTDKAAMGGGPPELEIRLSFDPEARVLEIRDTGVGMGKEELVANLGTIAKSGTSAFLDALGGGGKGGGKADKAAPKKGGSAATSDSASLIGQFGVGFYSAYLVADRVQVVSAPASGGGKAQFVWESDADGAFEVYEDKDGERLGRGTAVRLFLKADKPEYGDLGKLKALVAKYSEFVGHPILLNASRTVEEEVEEAGAKEGGDTKKDAAAEFSIEDEEEVEDTGSAKQKKPATVKKTVWAWERLNDVAPVWLRPPSDVSEADHAAFYSALAKTGPSAPPPLAHAHFKAEGDVEFRAILYVPPTPPPSFYENYYSAAPSVRLYVRRVFVGDDFGKDLLPKYLGFLAGVVDSDSLPLSVSRETLQAAPALRTIKKKVVRKALDALKKLADAEEATTGSAGKKGGLFGKKAGKNDGKEEGGPYTKFWAGFGKAVKLGVMEDAPNRARLAKLLRFETSAAGVGPPGAPNSTSLAGYVGRMKDGQKAIFYLTGGDRAALEKSPFASRLAASGVEALFFTDAIDEYLAQHLTEFDGVKLQSASKEGLALGDEDGGDKAQAKAVRAAFKPLAAWWKDTLGGPSVVSAVRIVPAGLGHAPAVVTTSAYGWSAHMERIIKAQALAGSEGAARAAYMKGSKILEVNPRHALVRALYAAHGADPSDPKAASLARLIWDAALMESGFEVEDTPAFAARLHAAAGAAYGGLEAGAVGELADPVVPELVEEEEEVKAPKKKAAKKEEEGAGLSLDLDGGADEGKDEL